MDKMFCFHSKPGWPSGAAFGLKIQCAMAYVGSNPTLDNNYAFKSSSLDREFSFTVRLRTQDLSHVSVFRSLDLQVRAGLFGLNDLLKILIT